MHYSIERSIEILKNTPGVLSALFEDLHAQWYNAHEEENTWSPKEIVAHLILGEKTDWVVRIKKIIFENDNHFDPFDMEGHLAYAKERTIQQLLEEFRFLREENIIAFKDFHLSENDLLKKGIHPEFGEVTLKQHLAAWVVHDFGHIAQITRIMSKEYKEEVGPWLSYMPILTR